jgi:hypothetical protein
VFIIIAGVYQLTKVLKAKNGWYAHFFIYILAFLVLQFIKYLLNL